jgi:hypothetical protein
MTIAELNKRLRALQDKADRMLENGASNRTAAVLAEYKKTRNAVRSKIESLIEDPNFVKLGAAAKAKKLKAVYDQIGAEIKALNSKASNTIHEGVAKSYKEGFATTTVAITDEVSAAFGIKLDFKIPNQASIDYAMSDNLWLDLLKQHNGKLMTDIKLAVETSIRTNVRAEVATGLSQGLPYEKVIKAIKERFDVAAGRAKVITFTEMHKSHSKGRVEGVDRAMDAGERLGLKTEKVWRHNDIGVPRESHLRADGIAAVNGMFSVGGESMTAPGLGADPANNINCHCSAQFQIVGYESEDLKLARRKNAA